MPRQTKLNWVQADPESPEGKLYKIVMTALKFMTPGEFIQTVSGAILSLPDSGLTEAQKTAVESAARQMSFNPMFSDEVGGENGVLNKLLYASWPELGVTTLAPTSNLVDAQRNGFLQIVYGVCVATINAKITEYQTLISWPFEAPDWVLEVPTPEPEPEPQP